MMAMLEGDGAAEAVLGLCFGQLEFSELAAARRSAACAGGRRSEVEPGSGSWAVSSQWRRT